MGLDRHSINDVMYVCHSFTEVEDTLPSAAFLSKSGNKY